jgi:hypothetical protein
VLQYLKGTVHYGLMYAGYGELMLHGFVDSNYTGDASDKKSTSGCCFCLASGVISWFKKKQDSVALCSMKAKYMAANTTSCEADFAS